MTVDLLSLLINEEYGCAEATWDIPLPPGVPSLVVLDVATEQLTSGDIEIPDGWAVGHPNDVQVWRNEERSCYTARAKFQITREATP